MVWWLFLCCATGMSYRKGRGGFQYSCSALVNGSGGGADHGISKYQYHLVSGYRNVDFPINAGYRGNFSGSLSSKSGKPVWISACRNTKTTGQDCR